MLQSLNIECSTAFMPRKDVALKDITPGVDENMSLGPLVANLGEDGPCSVVLMLWKGGEKHPLLPESKKRCAQFGVSCKIVKNAELSRAVVVSNIFLLCLVWRDVCADCCGVASFSARIRRSDSRLLVRFHNAASIL